MKVASMIAAFFIHLIPSSALAQIISPGIEDTNRRCGEEVKTKEVMVLDLEPFGQDSEGALAFAQKHAGNYRLVNEQPEEIETAMQGVWYSRKSGIKKARKEAAERGCNLVFVVSAGTNDKSRVITDSQGRVKTVTHRRGVAIVLMGTRGDR